MVAFQVNGVVPWTPSIWSEGVILPPTVKVMFGQPGDGFVVNTEPETLPLLDVIVQMKPYVSCHELTNGS